MEADQPNVVLRNNLGDLRLEGVHLHLTSTKELFAEFMALVRVGNDRNAMQIFL